MAFLPVVERELRVTSRRPWMYWLRFGAAGALLLIFIFVQASRGGRAGTQLGGETLHWMSMFVLGLAMFAGLFLTADSISQEKREGTLGLLFLTPLRAADVVLGKFAACSATAIFALLAVLPTLALPVLIGGVTGGEVFRLAIVLTVTFLYALAQGTFVSVLTGDGRIALGGTFLLGIILVGLFPALWWLQHSILDWRALDWLLWPSPGYAFIKAFDAGYSGPLGAAPFWNSIITIAALTFLLMAAAVAILTWNWREREERSPSLEKKSREPIESNSGRPFLVVNPFEWLAMKTAGVNTFVSRAVAFFLLLWSIFLVASVSGSKPIPLFITCLLIGYILHVLVKVAIAIEAARRFNEDRRNGALELLLVTPLKVEQILVGQAKAVWGKFQGSRKALWLMNVGFMFVTLLCGETLQMSGGDQGIFCLIYLGGVLALGVDSFALSWVGMAAGLRSRKSHRAVMGTLLKIMGPSWLIIFLVFIAEPGMDQEEVMGFVIFWNILGVAVATVFGRAARKRLGANLRTLAAEGT